MTHIRWHHQPASGVPLGGKAAALARLGLAGFPVPPWFVLLPSAFENGSLLPEAADELRAAVAELNPDGGLQAVRSSASDEDGPDHAFAGQLDSFLNVPPGEVAARAADVWRSGFGERVLAYRREHGLPLPPSPPAVIVQRMVPADTAGVAFGADPVSGRRGVAVVSAVRGLGTPLVGGESDADTWRIDTAGQIVQRHLVGGTPALTDTQVVQVADLARSVGKLFGRPQDIEWAFAGDHLFLLQSRPITALAARPDPDGVRNLWDNSNIAESYNGLTAPLTFTFARRVYEAVYRQFCRLLGVPAATIDANSGVFRRMLGLVRGRVYYNLLNWYRLLAMLPGFKANRGFMERMMGVKEPLPDDVQSELAAVGWWGRLRDRVRLFGSVFAVVRHHFTLPGRVRQFYRRLDDALGKTRPDFSNQRPEEMVAYFRAVEGKLITRWDAPLLNDFFAMIFFGVLGKQTKGWCGDDTGTLANELVGGEGGMISAEPALRVRALADLARGNEGLVAALRTGGLPEVEAVAPPDFRTALREYLDKFGERCAEELKLESLTLSDAPGPLLRSVGSLASRPANDRPAVSPRPAAEQRVRNALRGHPVRRLLFGWVLKNARHRVRDRENLRFERTRVFGRVRELVGELGRQFHARGVLDDPRDVFFLEVDEVLEYVEGTAACADLRGLVGVRKAEYARYRNADPPADRFETHGLVYVGHSYEPTRPPVSGDGEQRTGLGCCPGVVRGPVRVVTDPRGVELQPGEILVAERTDPGWVLLFPAAAGLLVERGSLLSHSAIVARELGLPAVVSLAGVTRWLRTGDEVEMDGASGVVRRLGAGE